MAHLRSSVLVNDRLTTALRFVVNLFVIDEKCKDACLNGVNDEEKDLEEILKDRACDMNIFRYLVPTFIREPV